MGVVELKSLVFFNNKGGVGKTTLLCNVAAYLALEKHKKVLVVDADPQCNSTSYAFSDEFVEDMYSKQKRETIESFLQPVKRGKGYLEERIKPLKSPRFGFDFIAGDPNLALSEDLLAGDWDSACAGKPRGLQTTLVFSDLAQQYQDYDYIFFDVGPSLGAINRSILIACDYFVIPMSVDVFSLMALSNIKLSLLKWKEGITDGLNKYLNEEQHAYSIRDKDQTWHLNFAGYVMQQYKAKTVKGDRIHVRAYEKISKQIPEKIQAEIIQHFGDKCSTINLGEVENLHSLVPMSQSVNSPIFSLKSKDGVVGSHFSKVDDAKRVYSDIANNLIANIEG